MKLLIIYLIIFPKIEYFLTTTVLKKYMSSLIVPSNETSWMCNRCYRYNTSHEASDHCLNGCGYTVGEYIHKSIGWQCVKCDSKNCTALFSPYKCKKCNYKLNSKDLEKIVYL